jgi:hypothetical protein
MQSHTPQPPSLRHRAWGFVLPLCLCCILLPWIRLLNQDGNLTRPVRFGGDFDQRLIAPMRALPHVVQPGPGFDGQFYQQLAMDPLLLRADTARAMDDARIRGRRVLTPALAWTFSLGQPSWALWSYPLLSLVAWLGLGCILWRLLPRDGAGAAAFAAILLGPGVIEAASRALPDLPAFTLASASLLVVPGTALGLLAAAALGRETMLLGFLSRPLPRTGPGQAARWIVGGLAVLAPLALWALWLQLRFPGAERIDGTNLTWPLAGLAQRIQAMTTEWSLSEGSGPAAWLALRGPQSLLLVVSYLAQLAFIALRREPDSGLWRWAAASALFSLFLAWPTWEAFYTVTRHLLPLHLAFNVLLALRRPRGALTWFILGNAFALPRLLFWLGYP